MLEVKNLTKSFGTKKALDTVSIHVPKGFIYGLIGHNGAGKTTLIRILNGIAKKDSGEVLFEGENLSSKHISQIGYLPEERGLYRKMGVEEYLIYIARLNDMSKFEANGQVALWLSNLDLIEYQKSEIGSLSKGNQQKVQFIASVIHRPKLLILDEPFSGFDPLNAERLKQEILKLKENGTTIIYSTHRMESVDDLCDRLAILRKSQKVFEGSLDEARETLNQNQYVLSFTGKLVEKYKSFSIISVDQQKAILEKKTEFDTNNMLTELMATVQVLGFQKKLPSMEEVFFKFNA